MGALAKIEYYDANGRWVGSAHKDLPLFLDWMPIEAKLYWITLVGHGDPRATHALVDSQGERRLLTIETPLANYNITEYKEANHGGIEEQVADWCERNGIDRTPRNQ